MTNANPPARDGYDRWAPVYDHDANPLQALEEPHVRELLGDVRGLSVLDLGCGTGRHTLWLAAAGADVTHRVGRMAPLRLKGEPAEIGPAVEAVRRFALDHGLPDLATDALVVAVDEAISNILRHGYDDSAEPAVTIEAVADEEGVEVALVDGGRPFSPLDWPAPALEGGAAERPVGGLGIYLMRTLADRLTYRREGASNRLTLRKKRAAPLAGGGPGREDGPDIVGA